jgi:molybdopterin molybdotransferase
MDGYAFASTDKPLTGDFQLSVIGTAWAGQPWLTPLSKNSCVRIFTGAVLPSGADSVVMQEQVQCADNTARFPAAVALQQNVRYAGEAVAQHSVLLTARRVLTAADIGLLAAVGIAEVSVLRPLKIIFFSTGDELVSLKQPLALGQIYDSNRYLLSALLTDPRYCVVDGGVLPDKADVLEKALWAASAAYDVIITTGGASAGEADYIHGVLQRLGEVAFWKIALKPGKPLAFGRLGQSYFFGLPGNPLAVFATWHKIVMPALCLLHGLTLPQTLKVTAVCTEPLKKAAGREELQCGILQQAADGAFTVASAGLQGSHALSTLSGANCYIVLPSSCQGVGRGENVVVEPFALFLS